jgi:hypothetical protein
MIAAIKPSPRVSGGAAAMPHDNCPQFPSYAECRLRYNIADSERKPGEVVHQSELDIPPIDEDEHEHDELFDRIGPVIVKHNKRYGFDTDEPGVRDFYFHVAEQFRGDRMTEVAAHGKAEYTVELILDLQELLRGPLRLWRIVVEAPMHDDAILVYPNCWRNSDAAPGEALEKTLLRANAHKHSYERLLDRYACVDRPGLRLESPPRLWEAKIIYNATPSIANDDWPVFTTVPISEELSTDEYLEFEKDLLPALERHGPVWVKSDLSDTSKTRRNLFWLTRIIMDMQWDRTRILVKYGERQFTDELIADIQSVLKRWPLWRVALDAEDERDVRFVYPEMVL